MPFLIHVALPALRAVVLTVAAGNSAAQQALRRLVAWHRRQMATDPAYPTILAVIAAGILRLVVPNRAQAAILAAFIAKALGLNPPEYGNGWNPTEDYM